MSQNEKARSGETDRDVGMWEMRAPVSIVGSKLKVGIANPRLQDQI